MMPGKHEIVLQTDETPSEVWVYLSEGCMAGCGQQEISMCGVQILDKGFLIKGDIRSNMAVVHCEIKYFETVGD
jgi:hypothetical protein